jgi:cysteine synthase A
MKYAKNVTELIGNTPLVQLGLASQNRTLVLGKCEFLNPTHSVKDRIAYNMIQTAIESGEIHSNSVLIEPTSGNTGIGLAAVCAAKGLKLILTMPSSMSTERQKLLGALGAELVLTDPAKGMKGAIDKAKAMAETIDNAYILQQFDNVANPQIHRETTALEILQDTGGDIDIFVASIGTGGTITGIGEVLKEHNPEIQIIAVEPDKSAVLSGERPAPHAIQGIGAGFIPSVLNTDIYTEVLRVRDEDAINISRKLALEEGLLVGISSGANVYAATQIASREENAGKTIVTILCDTGERYLSSALYPKSLECDDSV